MTRSCENCFFAHPRVTDATYTCRRYAPRSHTGPRDPGETMYGWFPLTSSAR